MLKYEITKKTCALIAINEKETEIIETHKKIIIHNKITTIIKENCEYYGSSLEGRIKGSKSQLGMKYKLPIIIENHSELIFFPTTSIRAENCCWISLKNIKKYHSTENGTTIEFSENIKETFPISIESLENQIFRATKLMLITRKRSGIEK